MDLCRSLTPRSSGVDQSSGETGQMRSGEFSLSSISTNPFLSYELNPGEKADPVGNSSTNPFSENISRTPPGALPSAIREAQSPPTDPDATPLAPEQPSSASAGAPLSLDSLLRSADQQQQQQATPTTNAATSASAGITITTAAVSQISPTVAPSQSQPLHAQTQSTAAQLYAPQPQVPTSAPSQAAGPMGMGDVDWQKSRVFIAKYAYDPMRQSPNENPELELPLSVGDHILVFGEMDEVRIFGLVRLYMYRFQYFFECFCLLRVARTFGHWRVAWRHAIDNSIILSGAHFASEASEARRRARH